MTLRSVGWMLLLGSPGIAAGVAMTVIELLPARGQAGDLIGFAILGVGGLGSAAGAFLLTKGEDGIVVYAASLIAFFGSVTIGWVTAAAVSELYTYLSPPR